MTHEMLFLGLVSTQITIHSFNFSMTQSWWHGIGVKSDSIHILIIQLETEHSDPHATQPQVSSKTSSPLNKQ